MLGFQEGSVSREREIEQKGTGHGARQTKLGLIDPMGCFFSILIWVGLLGLTRSSIMFFDLRERWSNRWRKENRPSHWTDEADEANSGDAEGGREMARVTTGEKGRLTEDTGQVSRFSISPSLIQF